MSMAMDAPLPTGPMSASFSSVADMWSHRVGSTPDSVAMTRRVDGQWVSMTWGEADARVRALAGWLLSVGLERQERCAILATTRVEWILADMGILCAGGATTTVHTTQTPDECGFILADCQARVVFCDRAEQARAVLALRDDLPDLQHIVVFDDDGDLPEDDLVHALHRVERSGQDFLDAHPGRLEAVRDGVEPDHLATLIYTSGTTGRPKGVMLTHDAWVYVAEAIDKLGLITPADKQFLFLPLAHVFAKMLQVLFIRLGVPTAVDGSMDRLIPNLAEVQPTWLGAVPRVFEKAYNQVVTRAKDSGPVAWRTFTWALAVGRQVSQLRQRGKEPTGLLRAKFLLADALVFRRVKETFGGQIRFMISGAAPLSVEIAEFFHACDLLILEGYGLTESAAATAVNTPLDVIFGTVGKPLPGCGIRIADDGEILLRSRAVMKGYHGLPEATAEALSEDGWLHTGDIGTLRPTGHLEITDRKKEIIVTAGGKNVAPAPIQHGLVTRSPWVAQCLVHGDRRNFCSALITLDLDRVTAWAAEEGLPTTPPAVLAQRPEVRDLVQQSVDDLNRGLPPYERIRRFAIVPEPFTVDNGMLTPSLKLKRREIESRHADLLEGFYEGTVARMG